MSSVCRVFIATSLDVFIARPDGSIDWLERANPLAPPGDQFGYDTFISSVVALVMGRKSFETVNLMSPWPYGDKPVYVLSRTLSSLPPGSAPSLRLVQGDPATVVAAAAANGHRSLYVDGGVTIQAFLAAGLIRELVITVVPVLIGAGRPLFGALSGDLRLQLLRSHSYRFGFVQNHYVVGSDA
jgi:dihydrofolate reductase